MKSDYQYKLIITKDRGLVPIEDISEGEEVFCFGEWKKSPAPEKHICIKCTFDLLPTTTFEKKFAAYKREVSINHLMPLSPTKLPKPELSIRGFFKENKKHSRTVFKNWKDVPYWLPRFIRMFNQPFIPYSTQIGWSLDNFNPYKFTELKDDELTERNLEYILEGMTRHTFSYDMGKYKTLPYTQWNETHKIVMRLLDIECDIHYDETVVKNPINFYRHIKDDYTKALIKDEDIIFNLRRSNELPHYTNGYQIKEKEEVIDWVLPGINPDINGMNPLNCHEEGFTRLDSINPLDYTHKRGNGSGVYLEDNLYKLSEKPVQR